MKIIKNKIIPFGDFLAINLFDYVFTKRDLKDYQKRHEEIHSEQMRELLYIPFYILYVLEFIIKFPLNVKRINIKIGTTILIIEKSTLGGNLYLIKVGVNHSLFI